MGKHLHTVNTNSEYFATRDVPTVSIGMPVYNGEKYIERALDSLLTQTFSDFDLIISDNDSTDKTAEICRKFIEKDNRIRYYRNNTNIGAWPNFESVVNLANGKYIMWAAVDDWWAPDFIKVLVDEHENHPEIGLAMTALHRYYEDGEYVDSLRFNPDAKINPNNMSYLEMLIVMATNYAVNRIGYHFFIYGLYRSEVLKLAIKTPTPQTHASDRVFMCQIALATTIRYIDVFSHVRTMNRKPLAIRQANETSITILNSERFAYTKTWLAIEPYLWSSKAIPEHRKCMISVASEIFMKTNWGVLYRGRENLTSFQGYNCDKTISDIGDEFFVLEYLLKNKVFERAHQLASSLALEYPDNPDLLTLLAEIKSHLGPKKFAKIILLDIIADCPKHSNALKNLAVILWDEGKRKDAIHLAKDAVKTGKDNLDAIFNLAKMLVETGDLEEGSGYLENVLMLYPQNIDALKLLGAVCVNQGHKQRAHELLKQAEKMAPDDEEIKKLILTAQVNT